MKKHFTSNEDLYYRKKRHRTIEANPALHEYWNTYVKEKSIGEIRNFWVEFGKRFKMNN